MFSFRTPLSQHPFMTLLMGSTAVLLVICIVSYPDQAFQASLQGLKIWWTIIFPALLPFLVLSEMLYAYGFVHGLGVMLDPIMRLLFRLPGVGGWAWSVGWTAGYPAGAKAVAQLRKQQTLSRQEAERLLCLSHANSPIFMIAVVGVGFMQQPHLGLVIAIVHWLSAILTTLIWRTLHRMHPELQAVRPNHNITKAHRNFYRRLISEMEEAHRQDGRPFGRMLGESVSSAVQTLMMVGGYMMIFSVIIQVLRIAIPQEFGKHILNGLFEVNLAAYTLGSTAFSSPVFQAALLSAVIAWSGISALLQVHSIIRETDLRFSHFLISRLLHALCAFLLTYVLWSPLHAWLSTPNSAMSTLSPFAASHTDVEHVSSILDSSGSLPFITYMSQLPIWAQASILIPVACLFLFALFVLAQTIGRLFTHR
ncbi:nucleoside recognition domain-containing protein [Paenibacillus alvei]|uniref:nucleoside recognition domain-containing protein n=1 Tax=Paenibacillus alvei TaxID=44250 RepID=UPI0018CEBAA8|nr:nucleoside recognition domain-containing protein [Paenibacillus alvei]MBG9733122.1 nucleoside recognition domain-containing protein [Paenibacillus alvei]MBG9745318.1 nucleoside recognition domain-containing protein [Paenibacillus alvei]MCY9580526.1 nucleoside recognition domain-containing protein [Paenibacillus alvei]MCY9585010.1 nucleoside recognition domain-containing protein [Paenibacillus alvei]